MEGIIIRDMDPKDIPFVVEIEQDSFSMPWSRNAFYSEVYSPLSYHKVATYMGNIVGYICIWIIGTDAHILNLAVHRNWRRMGIASSLLMEALKDMLFKRVEFIDLEVRASNMAAIRLYEKFGFKPVGIRKGYYEAPKEDAVIMELSFEGISDDGLLET